MLTTKAGLSSSNTRGSKFLPVRDRPQVTISISMILNVLGADLHHEPFKEYFLLAGDVNCRSGFGFRQQNDQRAETFLYQKWLEVESKIGMVPAQFAGVRGHPA